MMMMMMCGCILEIIHVTRVLIYALYGSNSQKSVHRDMICACTRARILVCFFSSSVTCLVGSVRSEWNTEPIYVIIYRPGFGDYSSNQGNIVILYNVFSPLIHGCIYTTMGGIRMCNLQPPPPHPVSRRKQMANKQVCCSLKKV